MPLGTRARAHSGRGVPASADGVPEYKVHGVSIDWATVPDLSPTTVPIDGWEIRDGIKYIPFGCVLAEITLPSAFTLRLSSDVNGGSYKITVTNSGGTHQTAAIDWDATAAEIQAAIAALTNVGDDGGTPAVDLVAVANGSRPREFTMTFDDSLGANTVSADGSTLTSSYLGGVVNVELEVGTGGAASGKYGPFDDGASDGRQTLARGKCVVLNYTLVNDPLYETHTDFAGGVFEGGRVYVPRLKKLDSSDFVVCPWADIDDAFPRLVPVGG